MASKRWENTFHLTETEAVRYDGFAKQHQHPGETGAIGGQSSFTFVVTSIGVMKSADCSVCGANVELNDEL